MDEIKVRYRELARRFHPDLNDDVRAHARFRAIAAACQELLALDAALLAFEPELSAPEVNCGAPVDGALSGGADPEVPGDGLRYRRAELRIRLVRCEQSLRRAQTDAQDGVAKAAAARARGNESMARHFDRRAEADHSRALGLIGEIAKIKQEFEMLTLAGPNA